MFCPELEAGLASYSMEKKKKKVKELYNIPDQDGI